MAETQSGEPKEYQIGKVNEKLDRFKLLEKPLEWIIKKLGEQRAEDMYRNADIIANHVKPDDKVLDVGVGLGQTLKKFSEKLNLNWNNVYSIDIGNILKEEVLKKRYTLAKGEKLPFVENTFDVTSLYDVCHHTPKPEDLLNEGKRITKPGGKIILLENLIGENWTKEDKERLFQFDNISNAQGDDTNPHSNHTLKEWEEIGKELGLKLVDHHEWNWGNIDFIPGASRVGNRDKPSKLRPFTDTVMVFIVEK